MDSRILCNKNINIKTLLSMVSGIPWVEPECRILVCRWSFGAWPEDAAPSRDAAPSAAQVRRARRAGRGCRQDRSGEVWGTMAGFSGACSKAALVVGVMPCGMYSNGSGCGCGNCQLANTTAPAIRKDRASP